MNIWAIQEKWVTLKDVALEFRFKCHLNREEEVECVCGGGGGDAM